MEEKTVMVKEDKPEIDLVSPEEVRTPYRDKYTITWVDGNEYDVVINESGIYWTKKENILNE